MNRSSNITSSSSFSPPAFLIYIKIPIYIVGILTNMLNISVFLSRRLKDASYKVMLFKAVANLLYLVIGLETDILSNCSNCPLSRSYIAAINYTMIYIFFSSCLHSYRVLLDVLLSAYIYMILINKPCSSKYTYLWVFGLFVAAVAFYAQKPFMFVITQIPNTSFYTFAYSEFGSSWFNKTFLLVQVFIRNFLAVIIVPTVNLLNLIKFIRQKFKSQSMY